MNTELQTRQVLIVEDKESAASETIASAIDRLIQALEDKDISVQIAESYCEAFPVVETNMDIDCFLVASDMDYDKASESRAAKLLEESDLSAGEIINAVGYENESFFREMFKEKYGKNMLEYRNFMRGLKK